MRTLLVGILLGVALVVVGGIAILIFYSGPELSVQVFAPAEAESGQGFTVRLQVVNPHDEVVTLDSIDIDNSVFDNFEVVSVQPPPTADSPIAIIGQQSWSFYRDLGPGEEQSVELELITSASGTFQLPIDVCNSYQDCSRNLVSVRVASAATE